MNNSVGFYYAMFIAEGYKPGARTWRAAVVYLQS